MEKLLEIMHELRQKCPWDQQQTPNSLTRYAIEEAYEVEGSEDGKKVAIMDFGIKKHIVESFVNRGCNVKVFNAYTNFKEIEDKARCFEVIFFVFNFCKATAPA